MNYEQIESDAKNNIENIIHEVQCKGGSLMSKFTCVSSFFLGKRYELNPLGEGLTAEYDQYPLYRVDTFDCVTFVETVLALLDATSILDFENKLIHIRYCDGTIAYSSRHHFLELGWDHALATLGRLTEVTSSFLAGPNDLLSRVSSIINLAGWYQSKTLETIRLRCNSNSKVLGHKLHCLHSLSHQFGVLKSEMDYIPVSSLFDKAGAPNLALFSQLPELALLYIIRPNWDLRKAIGTHLNVCHLGFLMHDKQDFRFIHSWVTAGAVVNISAVEYFSRLNDSGIDYGLRVFTVNEEGDA